MAPIKITLSFLDVEDLVRVIDVDSHETTLELLYMVVSMELPQGSSDASLVIMHEGKQLPPASSPSASQASLASLSIKDGDMLLIGMQRAAAAATPSSNPPPAENPMAISAADGSAVNPQAFINALKSDVATMGNIRMQNPNLARAIEDGNVSVLQQILKQAHAAKQAEAQRMRELDELAMADPMDPEAQKRIYEAMQKKNIEENMEMAMEHTPEAFGSVVMLYVNMAINGHPVTAFVDSGAQMTIMNEATAERTGLARLIDKRFSGVAKGVGTSKIIGRVHQAPLVVMGSDGKEKHMSCTVTVLESQDMEFLFGLDMLKRFQCNIDLMHNQLRFGSVDAALPFLSEGELPANIRGSMGEEKSAACGGSGSGSAPPPASPAPPPAAAGGGGNEEKVKALMSLGFPRDVCERALASAGGNQDMAASLLFEGGGM